MPRLRRGGVPAARLLLAVVAPASPAAMGTPGDALVEGVVEIDVLSFP